MPTGKDGKGNALRPRLINGIGDSGSSFPRGHHTITYSVTDSRGFKDYCFFTFEVAVHVCPTVPWPENGIKDCDGVEMIWGKSCTVRCNSGYDLQGGQRVTCRKDGTYVVPTCKAKICPVLTPPTNGIEYDCPEGRNYKSVCYIRCKKGYRATSAVYTICTESGNWREPLPQCEDYTAPVFDNCPVNPFIVYADTGLTSATFTYEPITATDNSGTVNLILVQGLPSGSRFERGTHVIQMNAEDQDRNRAYCFFSVSVQVLRCGVPDYSDVNMGIDCPSGYTLGSQCSIGCISGLPLVGSNKITCEKDDSDPPKTSWDFSLDSRPFCRALPCKNLTAPLNGALVCDDWAFGTFCNMMCNSNFDIPRTMDTSNRFICGLTSGQWSPTDNVPDCTEDREDRGPKKMVLPSKFYYFDGDCTTSTDVIKNNFIQALQNSPTWSQVCPVQEDCTAENVDVKCGPTSGRKKRNVEQHRYKREANELLIIFKIAIPFSVNGTSKENARDISAAKLNSIADGIKRDVVNGVFSSVAPGFTITNESVKFDWEDFECPEGQISNYASVSCRGCPTGMLYERTTENCTYCPRGTYQDEDFSLSCKSCPENTSTIREGSRNANNCLAICGIGESSPTGLTPCSPCQIGSYQDTGNSKTCKKCPADKSSATGSTSLTDCKGFDMILTGPIKLTSKPLESDMDNFTLSVWFKYKSPESNFTISLIKEGNSAVLINFASEINININGAAVTSQATISVWTNFVLTWLNINKSLKMYLGGQLVSTKTVSSLESELLKNASMEIKLTEGNEVTIRRAIVFDDAAVEDSSQTCDMTTPRTVLTSLNSMTADNKTNLSIVMPSTCDAVDECLSSPCGQHVCINELSGFKCKCSDGYTGDLCNIPPDYCLSNGCNTGATCNSISTNKTFTCTCPKGYKGTLCDVNIVNGGWGNWTYWSECSTTCGGGTSSRHRLCDNPSPDEDGEPCQGYDTKVKPCNNDTCPECKATDLARAHGSSVQCIGTTSRLDCEMICKPGTLYNGDETPNYTCIDGVWRPERKLLPCTEVTQSISVQIEATVNFPSPAICEHSEAFRNQISNKIREDTCAGSNTCQYEVIAPECSQGNRRKRDADTAVTIMLTKDLPEGDLGLAAYQTNGTISPQLKATVEAIEILELSGQMLQNQTENFTVTVNDVVYKATSVNVNGKTMCQPGSVGQAGVCGVCTEGTYENGNQCIDCKHGYYQDERGTVECKQCPSGWTTQYIGSVDESSCSVSSDTTTTTTRSQDEQSDVEDNTPNTLIIAVSSGVVCVVIVAIFGFIIYYVCKRNRFVQ
ncbi:sushi, von Willebrand factor type A, EGF and pentraxin domain-containing protein 1-like [Patella vulgata]|uniref:sushi, von Willebrand factor type A, EGF and pentraxin domain-containing protein 1-like n=1 Tax=Patella vulgata TaxID=6465 RepID=UPI0024A7DACE|nr:sushi, von Willebrand factor type A, EGF and pentraxin domain-containing protein 1-like [Patella vulgata]